MTFVMFNILKDFHSFARSFYDDCIIFGKRDEHLEQLNQVLQKLAQYGIHISFKKCQFFKEEVKFLGYSVSKNGIQPENSKTIQILEYKTPINTTEFIF